MIPATCFKNRKVALFGLGISGLPAAKSLLAGGATLVVWDDKPESRTIAAEAGFDVADLGTADWTTFDALILSPGVPLTHPEPHWVVKLAHEFDVPIIGDVELFERERAARAPKSRLVAITGTNGKSTTTALIAHVLETLGETVGLGGNIGRAVLELDDVRNDAVYVIEYSSYQIDLTPGLKPDAGLLLNLSPDHLDRHGDMAHYAEVKARLVQAAAENGLAIIGVDDQYGLDIAKKIESTGKKVAQISVLHPVPFGVYARDGILYECDGERHTEVGDLAGADALRGAHNWQNAAAAYAAARHFGHERGAILAALKSFPGLAHRMEPLGQIGDVRFVND
ncbi:MAG: UDP-N-acetylmuramoyl-L-alanine--D-glutamate ligase, partial [Fimbriimonadaceae bacterium]|nr:UDP-N-acetylmuramoyl-L-alanine--D-glutamate ligase [Alphaproteobacteria bacterium]